MTDLKTILYVEDEQDIRDIAQIALEDMGGFKVHFCADGQEAIQQAKNGEVPDLLLLDVMMPGMDGPTTLNELRKIPSFASIPVIFMTAKIQNDEIEEYKKRGAVAVIPKPFDPLTLADTIRAAWKKHHGQS